MNVVLAEKLLNQVMGWSPSEFNKLGLEFQAMATYKYDTYQQFTPGMRFTESLARWLGQFPSSKRAIAIQYVRSRLVFLSEDEMNHLVSISYPDVIRPLLFKAAADIANIEQHRIKKISVSPAFRRLERETLFLGLSDGARTDIFRRSNKHLSNEQVRNTHELMPERVTSLLQDLRKETNSIPDEKGPSEAFRTIVLLDDFSGSGLSYVRTEKDGGITGKLGKFVTSLSNPEHSYSGLVHKDGFDVIVVLYMATTKAEENLRTALETLAGARGFNVHILTVQQLSPMCQLDAQSAGEMEQLIQEFYDKKNESSATEIGGTDLRYGFNGCGLSLVLAHNTPNNSIGLLWAEGPKMTPLFPRITRHKDFV